MTITAPNAAKIASALKGTDFTMIPASGALASGEMSLVRSYLTPGAIRFLIWSERPFDLVFDGNDLHVVSLTPPIEIDTFYCNYDPMNMGQVVEESAPWRHLIGALCQAVYRG